MNLSDYEYYSRRERQEREHAARSSDHGARIVHLELANRYSAILRDIPQQMPQLAARA